MTTPLIPSTVSPEDNLEVQKLRKTMENDIYTPIDQSIASTSAEFQLFLETEWPRRKLENRIVDQFADQLLTSRGTDISEYDTKKAEMMDHIKEAAVALLQSEVPTTTSFDPSKSTSLIELMAHYIAEFDDGKPHEFASPKEQFTYQAIYLQRLLERIEFPDGHGGVKTLFVPLRTIEDAILTENIIQASFKNTYITREAGVKIADVVNRVPGISSLPNQQKKELIKRSEISLMREILSSPHTENAWRALGVKSEIDALSVKNNKEYFATVKREVQELQHKITAMKSLPPLSSFSFDRSDFDSTDPEHMNMLKALDAYKVLESDKNIQDFLDLKPADITYDNLLSIDLDDILITLKGIYTPASVFDSIHNIASTLHDPSKHNDFVEASQTHLFDFAHINELVDQLERAREVPPEAIEQKKAYAVLEYLRDYTQSNEDILRALDKDINLFTNKNNTKRAQELKVERNEVSRKLDEAKTLSEIISKPKLTLSTLNALKAKEVTSILDIQAPAKQILHEQLEDTVEKTLTEVKNELTDENIQETNAIETFIDDLKLNTNYFGNLEEAEREVQLFMDRIRKKYGKPLASLPNNISFRTGSWYHVQGKVPGAPKIDSFLRIIGFDSATKELIFEQGHEGKKTAIPLTHFAARMLSTAKKERTLENIAVVDFVMSEEDTKFKSVQELEEAISKFSHTDDKKRTFPKGLLKEGSQLSFQHLADKKDKKGRELKRETFTIAGIDEGKGVVKLDNGYTLSFPEIYLMATQNDPGNSVPVLSVAEAANAATPDVLKKRSKSESKGIKNKKSTVSRMSLRSLVVSGKAYIDDFGHERKRKNEMRDLMAQIRMFPVGHRLRERARQAYFGKEKEKMDGLKAELDIMDNDSMRDKVYKFMKAVRPGDPNIHKNDGYVMMEGKLMPAFDARTKVKNMFIYLLERYGTPYPFKEVEEFKHERYWLHIFAESETKRQEATIKARAYKDDMDSELELWQLHSLFRIQSEFYGYEFAARTEQAHDTGNANEAKLKADQAKVATKTGDMKNQLIGYIEDARWDGIELLFAKLSEKGVEAEEMFNLFLRMYYKMTFSKEGSPHKFRSEISREQVQNIGKAIFPKYPALYFFMFRNEDTYNSFGNILSNEAKWNWGWNEEEDRKPGEVLKPNKDLYKMFTLQGDYTLLNGYANKNSEYISKVHGPLATAQYQFDPTSDSMMWAQNPLLTASTRTFELAKSNYEVSGFKDIHWKNYMKAFLDQMEDLKNGDLNVTDKLAFTNYIRAAFYKSFYADLLSGGTPQYVKEQYSKLEEHRVGDEDDQVSMVMTNKKNIRKAYNFLSQYESRLRNVRLDFESCKAAAEVEPTELGNLPRGSSRAHFLP